MLYRESGAEQAIEDINAQYDWMRNARWAISEITMSVEGSDKGCGMEDWR